MFDFTSGGRKLELTLKTAVSFPLWSYGTYISELDLAYRKVAIVDRIGQLLAADYADNDLAVAKDTIGAFPTSDIKFEDFSEYRHLSLKNENPYIFWQEIITRKRPAVFYKSDDYFSPILGLKDEELHLLSAQVTSPGEFSILGGATFLSQLFFAYSEHKRREESAARAQELHEVQMTRELVQLRTEILKHEEALRALGIPPGVRQYQQIALNEIYRKHAKKADQLGVKITGINFRV
jgi:hypothetical protein